jgi:hypothetical protein
VDALGELIGGQAAAEGGGDRVAGEPDEEEDQRDRMRTVGKISRNRIRM